MDGTPLMTNRVAQGTFRVLYMVTGLFCSLLLVHLSSNSKDPSQQRVKRWGFSLEEALKDPVGRDQFLKFLESEFSSENLR